MTTVFHDPFGQQILITTTPVLAPSGYPFPVLTDWRVIVNALPETPTVAVMAGNTLQLKNPAWGGGATVTQVTFTATGPPPFSIFGGPLANFTRPVPFP